MDDFKALLAAPSTWFFGVGVSAILGVWWWKMNPATANLTLVVGIIGLALTALFHPWTSAQGWMIRSLWMIATASTLTLFVYYTLWSSRTVVAVAVPLPTSPASSPAGVIIPIPAGRLDIGPVSMDETRRRAVRHELDAMSESDREATRLIAATPATDERIREHLSSKGLPIEVGIVDRLQRVLATRDYTTGKLSIMPEFQSAVQEILFPSGAPQIRVARAAPDANNVSVNDQQCSGLGDLVTTGNQLLDELVAQRASDESRANVEKWRVDVREWLKRHAPRKLVLFESAEHDGMRPVNYPSAWGRFYGDVSGQLKALRSIYKETCS